MTGFLDRIAARAAGVAPVLRPRPLGMFEPDVGVAAEADFGAAVTAPEQGIRASAVTAVGSPAVVPAADRDVPVQAGPTPSVVARRDVGRAADGATATTAPVPDVQRRMLAVPAVVSAPVAGGAVAGDVTAPVGALAAPTRAHAPVAVDVVTPLPIAGAPPDGGRRLRVWGPATPALPPVGGAEAEGPMGVDRAPGGVREAARLPVAADVVAVEGGRGAARVQGAAKPEGSVGRVVAERAVGERRPASPVGVAPPVAVPRGAVRAAETAGAVEIHIGRVEILGPAVAVPVAPRVMPPVSLDAFLARRR